MLFVVQDISKGVRRTIVKPEKNSIFLNKGKTVNSIENRKFSKFRMMKRTSPLNFFLEI